MNYQHYYHAGNAADVFKHLVLIQLFQHLLKKPQPFCYLDTHAGLPGYNLADDKVLATKEFQQGIAQLWEQPVVNSREINDYLQLIQQFNAEPKLTFYPGSPRLAQALLRPQDRAVLCDLQEAVRQQLKMHFRGQAHIQTHLQDGYQALKAFLPPAEKRGLVLIDPPYEAMTDWSQLPVAIQTVYQRWPTGIYAIWYPIKEQRLVQGLLKAFTQLAIPNMLSTDFCPWPADVPNRLNGSGMIIINPPWQLNTRLQACLPELLTSLRQHSQGTTNTYWLVEPT